MFTCWTLDRRIFPRAMRNGLAPVWLAALLLLPGTAGAGVSGPCRVPEIFLTFDSDLVRTERLVDRSQPVRILLVGPLPDRQALSARKRSRLEEELNRRLPDIRFIIIDEIPPPGLARDDLDWLRGSIERLKPDLVIWQVGTGDALAATDPDDFARTLEQASDWLKGRDIDLVLIDPPFVPNVPHERLYGRIVAQIDVVSDREKMNVIQQYGATSYLFSSPYSGSRGKSGHACLPELMAEAIVRAAIR